MATPDFVLRLREQVGHAPLSLVGVAGIVLREIDGVEHVLLTERVDNGQWAVVTGILEPGEEPALGLLREIEEETGVLARVEELTWVRATPQVTYPNGDVAQYLDLAFRCRYVSGEAHVADDENAAVAWVPLDALPAMSDFGRARLDVALRSSGRAAFVLPEDECRAAARGECRAAAREETSR